MTKPFENEYLINTLYDALERVRGAHRTPERGKAEQTLTELIKSIEPHVTTAEEAYAMLGYRPEHAEELMEQLNELRKHMK